MNLTKSLKLALMGAGITALSVSAVNWVEDTFDYPLGWLTDGKIVSGGNIGVWSDPGGGDGSTVIDLGPGGYNAACSKPLEANDAFVLELNTEGATLKRVVNSPTGVDFYSAPIWVDMMVKFVLSDDPPTVSAIDDSLVMLYADAAHSNLWIRDVASDRFVEVDAHNSIDPEQWYRLTLKLAVDPSSDDIVFFILLNGEKLNGATGWMEDWSSQGGGPMFLTADGAGKTVVSSIEFQGTGFIDELVVTDEEPDITLPDQTLFAGTGEPVDPVKYDAWIARNIGKLPQGRDDVTLGMYEAYLLNVDPDDGAIAAQLKILSIEQDGSTTKIIIGAVDGTGASVITYADDESVYPNGVLKLKFAATLDALAAAPAFTINLNSSATLTNPGGYTGTVTVTGWEDDGTVTISVPAANFIRASIQ